jgi:hypothetical protein
MGIFSAINDQAKKINEEKVRQFLFDGEILENVYALSLDFVAITNKRLIFVDSKVFTKETGVVSVPFRAIDKIAIIKDKAWALGDRIEITTRNDKYELKLLKNGLEFYKELSYRICG